MFAVDGRLSGLVFFGHFDYDGANEFGGLVDCQTVVKRYIAYASASQGTQVSSRTEGCTDVASKRADICAFAAHDADFYFRWRERQKLNLVDYKDFGLQLHLATLAGEVVGALAVDFHCRVRRGNLFDSSCKFRQGVAYKLLGDVFCGVGGVNLCLKVERRRGGSESDSGDVFLHAGLEKVDAFGGAPRTHDYNSRCEGVECAGVSHFHFLDFKSACERVSHACHGIERCPAQWLVDAENFSFYEIHASESEQAVTFGDADKAYDEAIYGKPYELAFLYNLKHPFAGDTSYHEGGEESNKQGHESE